MCWNAAASWNSAAIPSCLPTRDSTTPCGARRWARVMVGQASACQCRRYPDYNNLMRALSILLLCVAAVAQPKTGEWQSLFDGKTLQGWRETAFTGHAKVLVENGTVVLA